LEIWWSQIEFTDRHYGAVFVMWHYQYWPDVNYINMYTFITEFSTREWVTYYYIIRSLFSIITCNTVIRYFIYQHCTRVSMCELFIIDNCSFFCATIYMNLRIFFLVNLNFSPFNYRLDISCGQEIVNKQYHTFRTVPKTYIKIAET
jgi:hypothetical protein